MTYKRLRAGAQRQNSGSLVILTVLIVLGLFLSLLVALKVPATAITVLGAFFTTTVAVSTEQSVIERGPYRFIRHPSCHLSKNNSLL